MKKSQHSLELLAIVAVTILVIILFLLILVRPKEEMDMNEADHALGLFADAANKVGEMPSGNKRTVQFRLPDGVEVDYSNSGEVVFKFEGEVDSDLHALLKKPIVGFDFMEDGIPMPGDYELVFESFDTAICVYPPGERGTYCLSLIYLITINSHTVYPSPAYTRNNLSCYFDIEGGDSIYVNVTWYRKYGNGTVISWTEDDEQNIHVILGQNTSTTAVGDIESSDTLHTDEWMCEIFVVSGETNTTSNSSWKEIADYPATVIAWDSEQDEESQSQSNAPHIYVDNKTVFYTQYLYNDAQIPQVMATKESVGTINGVKAVDIDNNDVRDDFVLVSYQKGSFYLYGFYNNGTQAYKKLNTVFDHSNAIEAGDFDNDTKDEVAVLTRDGKLVVMEAEDGSITYQTTMEEGYSIKAGDIDRDGRRDDLALGVKNASSYYLITLKYNESTASYHKIWNKSISFVPYEVEINEAGDSLVGVAGSSIAVYNGNDGTKKYEKSEGPYFCLEFLDQDNDGGDDEVATAGAGIVDLWNEAGSSTVWEKQGLDAAMVEIEKTDLDDDGYSDDIVVGGYDRILAYDSEGTLLWTFRPPIRKFESIYFPNGTVLSIRAADVDNDGKDDIIFGGERHRYWILNRTGGIIGKHYHGFEADVVNHEGIGYNFSESPGIGAGEDMNDDGISDIISIRQTGYIYHGQQVVCRINISGDEDYMYYNSTSGLWEYYMYFNGTGFEYNPTGAIVPIVYNWSVGCDKGGYETAATGIKTINVTLKNASLDVFDQEDDDENQAGWLSETTATANSQLYFFANYTNNTIIDDSQLSMDIIWLTDLGSNLLDVRTIDLDGDGLRESFVFCENDDIYAYYTNGSQAWSYNNASFNETYGLAVGDFDNDSRDEVAGVTSLGFFILNNTGDLNHTIDYGRGFDIESGDIDGDGIDDIAISIDTGASNSKVVVTWYEPSSGIYNNSWNSSIYNGEIVEVKISEIDGDENLIAFSDGTGDEKAYVYWGNGTLYFSTDDLGTAVYSVEFFDYDGDGKMNDLVAGEYNDVFWYDEDSQIDSADTPTGFVYEIEAIDADNDGVRNEFILFDEYDAHILDEVGTEIKEINLDNAYYASLNVHDIDNDGREEIIIAGYDGTLYVYNASGAALNMINLNIPGSMGNDETIRFGPNDDKKTYGAGNGIAFTDFVNGSFYAAFSGDDAYVGILEIYPKCTINFSDGIRASMKYNTSASLYYYNRTFASSGSYTWNISCESKRHITRKDNDNTIVVDKACTNIYGLCLDDVIGYWPLDSSMNDMTEWGNNGTGLAHPIAGKRGFGYDFSDGNITVGNPEVLHFYGANNYTWMGWIWLSTGTGAVLGKHDFGSGAWLYFNSGTFTLYKALTAAGTGSTPLASQKWVHFAVNYSNGDFTFFLNGTSIGSDSDSFTDDTDNSIWFGSDGMNIFGCNGYLDEIIFFNRSLNESQIQQIYNETKDICDCESDEVCVYETCWEDLAGYWPAENNSYDYSGNSQDLRVLNDVANSSDGKVGNAYSYDGDRDAVTMEGIYNYTNNDNWTVSFWINATENADFMPFGLNSSDYNYIATYVSSDRIYFRNSSGSSAYVSTALNTNQWHLITVKNNGTDNVAVYLDGMHAGKIDIVPNWWVNGWGVSYASTGWDFNGSIDEVFMFNRTLTESEVRVLNLTSNPCNECADDQVCIGHRCYDDVVGYWKFDNNTLDSSNLGNDGTLYNAVATEFGKVREGYSLDGNGDYIQIANDGVDFNFSKRDFSVSIWVRNVERLNLFAMYQGWYTTGAGFCIYNGRIYCSDGTTTYFYTPQVNWGSSGEWHHIVGVADYSQLNLSIYMDGNYGGSVSLSADYDCGSDRAIKIGRYNGPTYDWNGTVDEVVIFNRSLTQSEIEQLYNDTR